MINCQLKTNLYVVSARRNTGNLKLPLYYTHCTKLSSCDTMYPVAEKAVIVCMCLLICHNHNSTRFYLGTVTRGYRIFFQRRTFLTLTFQRKILSKVFKPLHQGYPVE